MSRIEFVHKSIFSGETIWGYDPPDVSGLLLYQETTTMDIYVDGELMQEIERVEGHGGLRDIPYFHATNSLALPGISEHKAICSGRYLRERDEPIKTGEYSTETDEDRKERSLGLPDVYVSTDPTSRNYCFVRPGQEDRFPIIFGIGGDTADTIRRSHRGFLGGYEFRVPGKIGLHDVTSMTVPAEKIPEAEAWLAANRYCRGALALSFEAAQAITLGRGA